MIINNDNIIMLIIIVVYILRERDVAGIDVNMGCPKDFSLKVSSEIHSP